MEKFIITINRQFGSMGRPIAKEMAEALNVEFYDRDLIEAAAKKMNMSLSIASDLEESARPNRFWRMCFPLGHDESQKQDELFQVEKKIILDLADAKSCIIVGRCADYVLRDHPSVMNIYIYASYADRLANCVGPLHMEKSVAKKMIAGVDKARAAYHRYWAGYAANDPEHNHIIVNSALLEVEGTAQALAAIARVRFGADIALGEGREDHAPAAASQDV